MCPLLTTPILLLTLQKYRIQKEKHQDHYYGPHSTSSKPPKNYLKVINVAIRCCLMSLLGLGALDSREAEAPMTLDPAGVAGAAPGSQGTEHLIDLPIKNKIK